MSEANLGLMFEINADSTKAQAALAQFESATGTTFQSAAALAARAEKGIT